jgi:hypothetical protein
LGKRELNKIESLTNEQKASETNDSDAFCSVVYLIEEFQFLNINYISKIRRKSNENQVKKGEKVSRQSCHLFV